MAYKESKMTARIDIALQDAVQEKKPKTLTF